MSTPYKSFIVLLINQLPNFKTKGISLFGFLYPNTISLFLALSKNFGISFGSCCASASSTIIIPALLSVAKSQPVFNAAPLPILTTWLKTIAFFFFADYFSYTFFLVVRRDNCPDFVCHLRIICVV